MPTEITNTIKTRIGCVSGNNRAKQVKVQNRGVINIMHTKIKYLVTLTAEDHLCSFKHLVTENGMPVFLSPVSMNGYHKLLTHLAPSELYIFTIKKKNQPTTTKK